jgi:GTP cyclohydrolase I
MAVPLTLVRDDNLLRFPVGLLNAAPARQEAEIVFAPAIPFHALCEDHLLPYDGTVHIGYVPDEKHLSRTELTRIVEACSGGIQVQQQMTTRIGLWLHHQLSPRGVGVLVEGARACVTARGGIPIAGPPTTLAFYGSLRDSADEQREFLALARKTADSKDE